MLITKFTLPNMNVDVLQNARVREAVAIGIKCGNLRRHRLELHSHHLLSGGVHAVQLLFRVLFQGA